MTTNVAASIPAVNEGLHGCKPGDDNCWNVIGISGDRSCPELNSRVLCRNCPVFAAAARRFFDRPAPEGYLAEWSRWLAGSTDQDAREQENREGNDGIESRGEGQSVLIFRLGPEWQAFRTETVVLVTTPRPVHRVPHRTNDVFLGLVNLRGQAQLCVSLHGLLGITVSSTPARLVLLCDQERAETWAFGADEILGVERVPRVCWRDVPSTLVNPAVGFSQAVLAWKERSIGLLDERRIFTALGSLGP